MKKPSIKKAKKKLSERKQAIMNFCKKHPGWAIGIGGIGATIFIGVLAIIINIHYGKNAATKEDVKQVQIELEKTRGKLHSFIDGFAENTSQDEPLKGEIKKADSLYHQNKYKEAYNIYDEINKKALSKGKEKIFALSLMGKGISIGKQMDYQRAIGILRNAEEYKDFLDDNAKVKLYFNLGYCNQMLKNDDLAIEYYGKSLDIGPNIINIPIICNNRGLAYAKKGDYERAIRDFDKGIELNPELVEACNNRGLAYAKKGDYERAIRDFDKGIELNPELVEAYNNRGNAYEGIGEYKQAIQDLDKAIELNPEFAEAYYNRGLAYAKKGEYEQAIQDFDKAIELNPEFAGAYNNRGNACRIIGDYERAIQDLDKAIELNPEFAGTYFNKALACEKIKRNKEAIKSYKKYIEFVPEKEQKRIKNSRQRIKELQKKIDKNNQSKNS